MNKIASRLGLHLLRAAVLLGFLLSAQAALAADSGRLYTSLTGPELLKIMKDEGYSARLDEDEDIRWRLQGRNCLILFYADNTALQFYFGVTGTSVTLKQINEWNAGKRYSRAYLDSDGDPCLELDLDLAGGVSRARIVDFLRTCNLSFGRWESDVIR
jgi:hypothetical protein